MPRPKRRNIRKRFQSLYQLIETELTEDNWRILILRAAGFVYKYDDLPGLFFTHPSLLKWAPNKKAFIRPRRGVDAYPDWTRDILDLKSAKALQARLRRELEAIKKGDFSPAHISWSEMILARFSRLKRRLTVPLHYEKRVAHSDGKPPFKTLGPVYEEMIERTCLGDGCGRKFMVPASSKQRTCGDDACRVDASNARRKDRRESLRPRPLRSPVPKRYTRS